MMASKDRDEEVNKNEVRSLEGNPDYRAGDHGDYRSGAPDGDGHQPAPLRLRKKTWRPYLKGAAVMSLGFFAFMVALSVLLGLPWGPWYWYAMILGTGAAWGASSVGRWGDDYEGYVRRPKKG